MTESAKPAETARELLRYTIAVVAYRGAKAIRGAPPAFADFSAGPTSRTPTEVLAHINDLYDWANRLVRGDWSWTDSVPGNWEAETARFHAALAALDAYLEGPAPLGVSAEKIMAGPVADSLTHIGQLTYLRRLAGVPVRGESYARAEIVTGRVGPVQTAAVREFD